MYVVLIGPDRGLATALADSGVEIERVNGVGSGDALREAGVEAADLLVLTDVGEATAVP
ncbi:MAG: CTP synthetase, partial [Actinobacteria bacterium]|nr:CTP synthetase [Actinomycetota bacterium]NIW30448.1 CTP synthetase [Actinomycetota bacterium]